MDYRSKDDTRLTKRAERKVGACGRILPHLGFAFLASIPGHSAIPTFPNPKKPPQRRGPQPTPEIQSERVALNGAGTLRIPSSVARIGAEAFANCSSITQAQDV